MSKYEYHNYTGTVDEVKAAGDKLKVIIDGKTFNVYKNKQDGTPNPLVKEAAIGAYGTWTYYIRRYKAFTTDDGTQVAAGESKYLTEFTAEEPFEVPATRDSGALNATPAQEIVERITATPQGSSWYDTVEDVSAESPLSGTDAVGGEVRESPSPGTLHDSPSPSPHNDDAKRLAVKLMDALQEFLGT